MLERGWEARHGLVSQGGLKLFVDRSYEHAGDCIRNFLSNYVPPEIKGYKLVPNFTWALLMHFCDFCVNQLVGNQNNVGPLREGGTRKLMPTRTAPALADRARSTEHPSDVPCLAAKARSLTTITGPRTRCSSLL